MSDPDGKMFVCLFVSTCQSVQLKLTAVSSASRSFITPISASPAQISLVKHHPVTSVHVQRDIRDIDPL